MLMLPGVCLPNAARSGHHSQAALRVISTMRPAYHDAWLLLLPTDISALAADHAQCRRISCQLA